MYLETGGNVFVYAVHRYDFIYCISLFTVYDDASITKYIINLVFKGENASGDAVTRDVYTQFFKEIFSMYSSGIHANVPTGLSADECEKLRRIVCHSFIQLNIFPVQIAKALFEQVVMDSVRHNVLLESFQEFVQKEDMMVLKKFKLEEQVDDVEESVLIGVFADCGVTRLPTRDNIDDVIIEAERKVFIEKPYFTVIQIRKELGTFWGNISVEDIDHLWERYKPTTKKVLEYICFDAIVMPADKKVSSYLRRYVSGTTKETLSLLLQFATGSSRIEDGCSIKVKFVNQDGHNLTITSQACSKILYLPKQFNCFEQFKPVCDLILQNPTFWDMSD